MTLRKEKLEGFKRVLFERRESIASDLRQATQNFIADEEVHADAVDQAAADTDRTLVMQMKNREREILFQIDAALRQVDNGTFGECERCSESIAEARLKAFPFTTLCIDCKAELESEEHRFPGRA
jgi:DnaK suppressor protein